MRDCMTDFVLTHKKKGVHSDTGVQVPQFGRKSLKVLLNTHLLDLWFKALKATRQFVGVIVIHFLFFSDFPPEALSHSIFL